VAIANRLSRVIYKVLGGNTQYKDLEYMRGDPVEKQIETYVRKLKKIGCGYSSRKSSDDCKKKTNS